MQLKDRQRLEYLMTKVDIVELDFTQAAVVANYKKTMWWVEIETSQPVFYNPGVKGGWSRTVGFRQTRMRETAEALAAEINDRIQRMRL